MDRIRVSNLVRIALSCLICVGMSNAGAKDVMGNHRLEIIRGEPAIGPNFGINGPLRDNGTLFGWPLGATGFSELGIYNPEGDQPLPLTPDTDPSATLATFIDPNFIEAIGFDPTDLDQSFINVPLQQVKTLTDVVGPDGSVTVQREHLPAIFESEPFAPSIAAPNSPVTLEQWLSARGKAVVGCDNSGRGTVHLKMRNLIPNRLYTVWGAAISAERGPFNQPFGGAPSAFATDENGNGSFKRTLNYCPLDPVDHIDAQLMWIMVVLHSDHMAYGGAFTTNRDSLFGGTVAHVHMEFHLLGEPTME